MWSCGGQDIALNCLAISLASWECWPKQHEIAQTHFPKCINNKALSNVCEQTSFSFHMQNSMCFAYDSPQPHPKVLKQFKRYFVYLECMSLYIVLFKYIKKVAFKLPFLFDSDTESYKVVYNTLSMVESISLLPLLCL